MFHIPLPGTALTLVLAPRFSALHWSLQLLLPLLVVGLALGLIIRLYRDELKLISRPAAAFLLGLRSLLVLLLAAVILLQPVLSGTTSEQLPGRVLVAIDRSDSMGSPDPQRTPADKLKLARALKLADAEQIDRWLKEYEASQNPLFAPAEQETHDELLKTVDRLSRAQIARQVLTPSGGDLLERVKAKHGLEVIGFAQDRVDLSPDRPEDLGPPLVAPQPASNAAAAFTDLKVPLRRSLELSGPGGQKVLGVVVLTDGQHNWGEPPLAKALELGERQLPVFPIALGAKQPPPDVAIVSAKADPPQVFLGAEAPVEAVVQITGMPKGDIPIKLERPKGEPLEQTIAHDGVTSIYRVRFRPKLAEAGTQVLTVSVPERPGEIRADNNRRQVPVRVANDKAKVLVVDGEMRWECHYLLTALERDPKMQVTAVVFDQPRLGLVEPKVLTATGFPATELPTDPDALASYDCIILGDVPPEKLPDPKVLDRYVRESGGTLVFVAGKRAMPLKYADSPVMDALLPVSKARELRPQNGYPLELTAEGREAGFLMMEDTSNKSDDRWPQFPLHYWGVAGAVKPGAVPLAYVPPEQRDPAPPDAAARAARQTSLERDNALIAWQNCGLGRTLYVGLDSIWRFRYRHGDTYHYRFWGQIILWAATDKALPTGNDAIRFGTRQPMYASGQEVELLARLGEGVAVPGAATLMGARVLRLADGKEEQVALATFERKPAQPRELTAQVRDLTPGEYEIELVMPELQGRLLDPASGKKLRAKFTVTPPDSAETVNLATNWGLLDELAAKSGGKVFTPETANELIDLLVSQTATRTTIVERPLSRSWWTLGLFLLLITAEWVARKWAGLP